ncbi:hypothetical protein AAFX91_39220 [Bradyrhizobium sp. 31Argb]|uniref:hypothetical protein n=1 Tax=Bradyrhizobium sp. 31Argb TaxID=3141247 RepID=UPI003749EE2A
MKKNFHHEVECSNGLLSTDVGLIAVNETHAVFSIRIPLSALRENHFFLNAISDIAAGGDSPEMPRKGENQ